MKTKVKFKSYSDWERSDKNLMEFLNIGDVVDDTMYNYFINVVPPATLTDRLVQIGEPYSISTYGKDIYMTLKRTSYGWIYSGTCHRGCSKNQTSKY